LSDSMQLIPAIDLLAGRCVRLLHGDFASKTDYSTDAPSLLEKYRLMGAAWLHVVDLDGARGLGDNNAPLIQRLAEQDGISLQVGGGIRHQATIETMLNRGVSRAVIGSAALSQVDEVKGWLAQFGAERLTIAFD